jgi:hypothetical protein
MAPVNLKMKAAIVLCGFAWFVSLAAAEKQCVAFSSDNSPSSQFSQSALQRAIGQSADIDFYPTEHGGCWAVHEISSAVTGTKSYAISWVVVDPHNGFIAHGLDLGPQNAFDRAMGAAAAAAVKDIRAKAGPTQP